jgi:DNA mismatch repair protein MutS
MTKPAKITPMMSQYNSIKEQYPDCILFFRLGDFYEMFGQDAVECATILDITLTSRTKSEDALPMCGVPYHAAESYIAKLNQKGKKVAVCEQYGDPKGPGIVERKVARIVTPSTNFSDYCLDQKANQFTGAVTFLPKARIYGLSICDVSTGEILTGEYSNLSELCSILSSFGAKELIGSPEVVENPINYKLISESVKDISISSFESEKDLAGMKSYLLSKFKLTTLNSLGLETKESLIQSTYLVLKYLESVLKVEISNINSVQSFKNEDYFELDRSTINNLELFYTNSDFDRKGSVLNAIDYTRTAAGGRLLKQWLIRPLKNLNKLQERLNVVEEHFNFSMDLEQVQDLLSRTYDLERVVSKVSLGMSTPRDLLMIKLSLEQIPLIKAFYTLKGGKSAEIANQLDELVVLYEKLNSALKEDAPLSRRDANIFNDGYNLEVDEYRKLLYQGKDYILKLQQDEIVKTGITNLKISYNKVFGYYIEVSNGRTNLVPDYFIRKQTLANSERYITPELKEYEEKVLSAEDKLKILEEKLFEELIAFTSEYLESLSKNAKILAKLDLFSSFAHLAYQKNYCKPVITNKKELKIVDGRHPVVENILSSGSFVPNDAMFEAEYIKLITGPNMGGKSTYLRQNAIIVLLAQIGCFVPASNAEIGIADQIFTRVGASDNLTKGLSTFMVEMEETAYILKQATENSLLILDEIGRGTSTFDGVSLAWAILEYIHDDLKARTLFATHYHELIELAKKLDNAENLSVAVEDDGNQTPVFLHKIKQGPVDRSYGVHVASMAGIPVGIVERASHLLENLENDNKIEFSENATQTTNLLGNRKQRSIITDELQDSLFNISSISPEQEKALEMLSGININEMTPLEALQKLYELKETIE